MDTQIIQAALQWAAHLRQQADHIEAAVGAVSRPPAEKEKRTYKKRAKAKARNLSPEARKRIAEAQKRRWAKARGGKEV